ncbi:MAG TPA: glycoside hydrolase family 127 protein [Anaerohalosphaeraceae bacterium]|nr:glycoside hydrolase family 127 protein [Anaerohalosphaeraceae bacterium]
MLTETLAGVMVSVMVLNTAAAQSADLPYRVRPMVPIQAEDFPLSQVRLLPGPFRNAMELDKAYLLSLEPDRLLAWFRKEAGLEPKAPVYGGWESQTIAGHSLGHYLSACALLYANEQDPQILERVEYIVDELALCQRKHGDGYVAAIPNGKKVFEEIARGQIRSAGFDLNGLWVPWYTTHKLMAGLRDACLYCGNRKALTVLTKLADWADQITSNLTDEDWQKMLACEHGGMNEVLADLYALTGDSKYLELSKKFYHRSVLEPLAAQEDRLAGLHANTQIPKVIGAARIYELTKEDKFKTIASFFWDRVVHYHSYVNGGNSSGEYFGPPGRLNDRLHDTTETCNTYNMLKLTRHLFAWEPKAEMMDYYERALYNHILAHQHPKTGMFKYKGFLDMPARKSFSQPFDDFWCCVGTGMENHVKYPESIYSRSADGKTLYVNLFIASELNWPEKKLSVRQETNFPNEPQSRLVFTASEPVSMTVRIRKPYWCKDIQVFLNDKSLSAAADSDGYIPVSAEFRSGDTIRLELPMTLRTESMPDNPNRIAFFSGPILLAADLDGNRPVPVLIGENKAVLASLKPLAREPLVFEAGRLGYVLDSSEPQDLTFRPLYQIVEQKYTVYLDLFTPEQWKQRKAEYEAEQKRRQEMEARTVDVLRIGEMQPERDHNLEGENTYTGIHNDRRWRDARDGGWFAFDMKVLPDVPMDLVVTYWGSESGPRRFDILVDGTKIAIQALGMDKPNQFYDVVYPIPEDLTKGKEKVKIRFQGHPQQIAGGVFGCRVIRR